MNETILDRVSEIGKSELEKLEKLKKDKSQETTGETKEASGGEPSTTEKKTEGNDEELKEEVTEEPEKEDTESQENTLKEWQEKTQKRIDDLISELKAEKSFRTKDAERIDMLREVISGLRNDLEMSGNIQSDNDKLEKSEEKLFIKIIEEDKDIPRERRREMSDTELEEFLLEDYAKASQWIIRRELRRDRDRADKKKNTQVADTIEKSAREFFTEYPECDKEARGKELMAQGKTEKEALDIIMNESPDFKLMMELIKENRAFADPNNPEAPKMLSAEMKKRKISQTKRVKEYTEDEIKRLQEEAVMKERERINSIDEGITSSSGTTQSSRASKDPVYKKGLELFIEGGRRKGKKWAEKDYQEILEYGNKLGKASPGR